MDFQEKRDSSEQIARRAYEIWEARGCPPSDGVEEWKAAEKELLSSHRTGVIATLKRIVAWRTERPTRKAG